MRKTAAALLLLLMIFSMCGCAKKKEDEQDILPPVEELVEVLLPADIAGEIDEGNLDGFIEYYGLEKAEINPDGSVRAFMTYERWLTTVALIRTQIDDQLGKIVGSGRYPDISGAAAGPNYDTFAIRTSNEEISEAERELCYLLGGYAYYQAVYYKVEPFRFTIDFINNASGEKIFSYDQDDWLAEKE